MNDYVLGSVWESNILNEICEQLACQAIVITDSHVQKLYGSVIQRYLDAPIIVLPAGEENKTREMKQAVEDQMLSLSLGRDTCVLAIGGGVVTDLAGFVASTYCRGIPFVNIPTTLLAMVDASIGGKTGVNTPHGKNLVGAFYEPECTLVDTRFLETLTQKEFRNGLAESIKHAVILDEKYFDSIDQNLDQILDRDEEALTNLVLKSHEIKSSIVSKDKKEGDIRRILNFGHTVGHALELLMDYAIPHGEAVAIGMMVEGYLSVKMGYLKEDEYASIVDLLTRAGFDLRLDFEVDALIEKMQLDKKSFRGQVRFVLLQGIGSAMEFDGAFCTSIEEEFLKKTLNELLHAVPCS